MTDPIPEFRVVLDGYAPGTDRFSSMASAVRDAHSATAPSGVRVRAVVECRDVTAWRRVYVSNPDGSCER